ncbi:MAG: hypothetical protein AB8B84_04705 [Granulosicoccus sp.]
MNASLSRHALTRYLPHNVCAVISRQWVRLACVSMMIAITTLAYPATVHAADALDREHAIEIAKERNGGDAKVLGVSTVQDASGNTQYAVKLLSNGRVRVFKINRAN